MFKYKSFRPPNVLRKVIKINNFESGMNTAMADSVMPFKFAKSSYNFGTAGGILENGAGVSPLLAVKEVGGEKAIVDIELPNGLKPLKTYHFTKFDYDLNIPADKLIIYTENGQLWYIDFFPNTPNEAMRLSDIELSSAPVFLNYNLEGEDTLIITSKTDSMVVWDGVNEPKIITGVPKINSMCIHYERLFVTVENEKNTLWFSEDLNPLNWNVNLREAGFIDMPSEAGRLLKVVSFMDYLFVFREYGITRINAYAVQEEFYVNELFVTAGKIFGDSVCICGDRIVFLAEDGLYVFDGLNTRKALLQLENFFDKQGNGNSKACYYSGKYYLLCQGKYLDEYMVDDGDVYNTLLIYNINTGLFNIARDLGIVDINKLLIGRSSGLVACIKEGEEFLIGGIDNSGCRFSEVLLKLWQTPFTDLGAPDRIKLIESVTIKTKEDIVIRVICDGIKRDVAFKGSDKMQTKRLKAFGNEIQFAFISRSRQPAIANFEAIIRVEGIG